MSRGPESKRSIDAALPVAKARGYVIFSKRERGSVSTFTIHADGYTAVVLVLPSRRLHATLAEMERQFGESLARIRLVPSGLYRSLEIWACSQHGVLRFFRVIRTGLVELGRDGEPLGRTGTG